MRHCVEHVAVAGLLQLLHGDANVVEDAVNAGAPGRQIRCRGLELLHAIVALDGVGADAEGLEMGEARGELRVTVSVAGLQGGEAERHLYVRE